MLCFDTRLLHVHVHTHKYTLTCMELYALFFLHVKEKKMLTRVDFLYITYSTDLYRIMCGKVSLLELMTIIL